jgi:hypothetical protein
MQLEMARSLDYNQRELHHESKNVIGQMADDYSKTSFQKWLAATTNNLRVDVDFHQREVFNIFGGRNDGAATDLTQSALPFNIPKNSPSFIAESKVPLDFAGRQTGKIRLNGLSALCERFAGPWTGSTRTQQRATRSLSFSPLFAAPPCATNASQIQIMYEGLTAAFMSAAVAAIAACASFKLGQCLVCPQSSGACLFLGVIRLCMFALALLAQLIFCLAASIPIGVTVFIGFAIDCFLPF